MQIRIFNNNLFQYRRVMKKYIILLSINFCSINSDHDPTIPPSIKKITNLEYKINLKGILITAEDKLCLINSDFYKEESEINEFTIKKIEKDHIIIKHNSGQEITINIDQ